MNVLRGRLMSRHTLVDDRWTRWCLITDLYANGLVTRCVIDKDKLSFIIIIIIIKKI